MARRYLQTGTTPSPAAGGAAELASAGGPVNVGSAAAPTIGQLMTATGGSAANWANPPASGIVDDPTIRNANFTAVAGTRYFIGSSVASVQVNMPIGPADGDIVVLCGVGVGNAIPSVLGNGNSFQFAGSTGPSFSFRARNLDLAFRFTTATGLWESIDTSVASLLYNSTGNAVVGSDNSGSPTRFQLVNGDSVLGRVESSEIQELRPWNVAHNLYEDSGLNEINFDVGPLATWLATVAFLRASSVQWLGAADLIVRGLYSSNASTEFRHDKVLLNNTGANGTGTFHNIIWKNEDTGAASPTYRVRHTAAAPSTDFADYVQGPGETVVLRYNAAIQRWFITPMAPSGRIDRSVTTTSVTPTIIHAYTTQTNSRVISYKVQVQARKTIGTTVGDSALFDITVLCERSSAGTVVVKDVVFINGPYKDAGAAGWDVTFTISGSDIRMNVVGDAVDTIQWRVVGNITEHG